MYGVLIGCACVVYLELQACMVMHLYVYLYVTEKEMSEHAFVKQVD